MIRASDAMFAGTEHVETWQKTDDWHLRRQMKGVL